MYMGFLLMNIQGRPPYIDLVPVVIVNRCGGLPAKQTWLSALVLKIVCRGLQKMIAETLGITNLFYIKQPALIWDE